MKGCAGGRASRQEAGVQRKATKSARSTQKRATAEREAVTCSGVGGGGPRLRAYMRRRPWSMAATADRLTTSQTPLCTAAGARASQMLGLDSGAAGGSWPAAAAAALMAATTACDFIWGGLHRRHYTWRVPQVPRADQMKSTCRAEQRMGKEAGCKCEPHRRSPSATKALVQRQLLRSRENWGKERRVLHYGREGRECYTRRSRPGAATRGQQQPAVGHKSSKERPTRQGESSQHSAAAADGATGAGYPERGRERDRQKGKKGEARQANEGKCGRPAGRAVHAATNRGGRQQAPTPAWQPAGRAGSPPAFLVSNFLI